MALPSSSDISRKTAAINQPCVSWFSMIFATCLGLASSKAVFISMLVHGGPHYTAMLQHGSSVVLPFPVFLSKICCHHLQLLTTNSIQASHMQFLTNFWFPLSLLAKKNTRCVPLRKNRCERNGPVASDPFLWFCIRFPQKDQFHKLPRTWRLHMTHEAFLKTLRNYTDLLQRQLFDHLAHNCVFRPTDFVVTHLGSGLQHQVNCDFCIASVVCKLLITFPFEVFNSVFLHFFRPPPRQCTLLHSASVVPFAFLLCPL